MRYRTFDLRHQPGPFISIHDFQDSGAIYTNTIKIHAKKQNESATSFINRAIDETIKRNNDSLNNI